MVEGEERIKEREEEEGGKRIKKKIYLIVKYGLKFSN